MDKSEVKKFSLIRGGGEDFSATKTKVAQSYLKWINLKSKNFPLSWGGGGGGLFCHKNQSCLKLAEMDKSEVKKFSFILGGRFSATKTKVTRIYLKWINLKSKKFPSSWGEAFLPQKPKLLWNCLKWINLKSKNFPPSWGEVFCHKNQSCSKIAWNG